MNLDPFDAHNDEEVWEALENAHLKTFVKGINQIYLHIFRVLFSRKVRLSMQLKSAYIICYMPIFNVSVLYHLFQKYHITSTITLCIHFKKFCLKLVTTRDVFLLIGIFKLICIFVGVLSSSNNSM